METQSLLTATIPNYGQIILEIINYTKYAKFKSHRFNLHEKMINKYAGLEKILFVKHNGQFVHHLGQFSMGRPRWQRKTPVIIERVYLYLKEDGSIGWNIKEITD
jgi:hypothetical protein